MKNLFLLTVVLLLLTGAAMAQTPTTTTPKTTTTTNKTTTTTKVKADKPAKPPKAPKVGKVVPTDDAGIKTCIDSKLSKSKMASEGFQAAVSVGTATFTGTTKVAGHKGGVSGIAKSCGAKSIKNNITVEGKAPKPPKEPKTPKTPKTTTPKTITTPKSTT